MKRRGFLKAMMTAPFAAKAALTKVDKVPLKDIPNDAVDTIIDDGKVIRLPSVMAATSCCTISTGSW